MNLQLCALLCNFLVLSTFTVVTGENVNMKKNVASKEKDIYIDDEDFADGSGNGDVIESSGSGYGPPDDDGAETRINLPGSKKTQLVNLPPKIEKEATLPMPSPKPQSPPPPPPPPQQPEIPVIDTFTTPVVLIQPEVKKLPEPEKEHPTDTFNTPVDKNPVEETNRNENVYITNSHDRDRTTSFFAQPGILAAVIGGAVVGLLCAILVVMFIVYRMRKKDEGSYALEEMKRCPATNPYMKPNHREFFA